MNRFDRGHGPTMPPLDRTVAPVIAAALREDLNTGGDLTTDAVIPPGASIEAVIVAKEPGRICGARIACNVFRTLDLTIRCRIVTPDAVDVAAGETIAELAGPARPVLTGERTALNLLAHLSGIATLTAAYVDAVSGTGVRIADTRKTTPGLRVLEKYAVRCGGGSNHRFGLDGAVLIKDNHVALTGGVAAAIERARRAVGHTVMIEVEVEDLDQLEEALDAGADLVLLDNMPPDRLRRAVALAKGRAIIEASGGITLDRVRTIAETGVDVISIGRLTHSAPALDVSLDVTPAAREA